MFMTGFATQAKELCRRFVRAGHEVFYLGHGYSGQTLKPKVKNGVEVAAANFEDGEELPFTILAGGRAPYCADVIQPYVRKLNIDVYGTLLDSFMVMPWYPQLDFTPAKTAFWYPSDGGWFPLGCENVLKKTNFPVAMSKHGQRQLKETYGIDCDHIPHGVKSEHFYPMPFEGKEQCKARWGMQGKFVVGCTARNQGRKMLDRQVKAFSIFAKDKNDVAMFMHSDPSDNAAPTNLIELAKRFNCAHKIVWSGMTFFNAFTTEDMRAVFNAMDVHFLTTCLPPEQEVITSDGVKNIENVIVGDKVLSHKGLFRKVTNVIKQENNKKRMVEITPMYSLPIRLTEDHLVYCNDEWIEAKDVKVGNFVGLPRIKEVKDKTHLTFESKSKVVNQFGATKTDHPTAKHLEQVKIDNDLMWLFGLYIAEGCLSQKKDRSEGIVLCIDSRKEELTEKILRIMHTSFNLLGTVKDDTRHRRTIRFYSSELGRKFKELFSSGAHNKKMPDWFVTLPFEKQKSLINGMWRGDGSIYYSKNKGSSEIDYTTVSKTLAYQLYILLIRLGYLPSINYNLKKQAYRIRIGGKQKYAFAEILGEELKESDTNKTWQFGFVSDDFAYMPVRKVGGDLKSLCPVVYDLKVEGERTFCSTIAIHNSGEGFIRSSNDRSIGMCSPQHNN